MQFTSVLPALKRASAAAVGALGILASGAVYADSIAPTSFSASLGVGESVTITKTVTVTAAPPTDALIDVMFVFDTTGSMGSAIAGAKTMADGLLTSLGSFGSVASGVAFYNDPGAGTVKAPVDTTAATTVAAITGLGASGGGDYAELGYDGISAAAAGGGWRAGSNRFIIALGDAGFKAGAATLASTLAAVGGISADVIGIDFCSSSGTCALAPTFASSITGLGGSVFASSTTPDAIAAAITAGITASFATYSKVTVDDLGGGLPEIAVSTVCTGADIGSCSGADAVGSYDRSVDRVFTFDYTFTRVAAGDKDFVTFALVDDKIVARELDSFKTPEPATLVLMGMGLLGLGAARRRSV
ncbi:MAG: PEP-CTERM sorting domain-containing protein [Candidatus Accumulibacter sp.]|uniref:PEP-CTERM sorting domain-containing protein n=1 Tax=Accumulibacter sp. TaxID=2053492 RepID=UPI001AD250CB|nr:PEP-CTERM sorting domain-containing protein [Accumulibacter sp.]MBN8517356.1 PEP-CTERM sorting domain-containing protein [Accumulibacter sp.]MBO3710758.1 PEP-CTERM sorting domain-containing protein [Accumulibacter sp.]